MEVEIEARDASPEPAKIDDDNSSSDEFESGSDSHEETQTDNDEIDEENDNDKPNVDDKVEVEVDPLQIDQSQKRYHCPQCKCSDTRKKNLTTHIRDKHTSQSSKIKKPPKKIQCKLCQRTYSARKAINLHIRNRHADYKGSFKDLVLEEKGLEDPEKDEDPTAKTNFQCPLCQQSFSLMPELISHIKDFHAESREKCEGQQVSSSSEQNNECPLCPKFFVRRDGLYNHVINVHIEHKPFQCQLCSSKNICKNFVNQKSLDKHLKKIHGPPRFKCEVCFLKFNDRSSFSVHRMLHSDERKFNCHHENCGKGFTRRDMMLLHLIRKHKESHPEVKTYKCELCPKLTTFYSKTQLDLHTVEAHVVDKSFECQECGKLFALETHLVQHSKYAHKGIKGDFFRLTCDVCSKGFQTKKFFLRHLAVEHKRFFYCSRCLRSFPNDEEFQEHSTIVPVPVSNDLLFPLKCQICLISLNSRCSFTIHTESHLKQIEKPEKEESPVEMDLNSVKQALPLKCDFCPKTFALGLHLSRHRSRVHGNHEWKCEVCAKCFKKRGAFTKHQSSHNTVRPHVCKVCEKSYKGRHNLLDHMRIAHGLSNRLSKE